MSHELEFLKFFSFYELNYAYFGEGRICLVQSMAVLQFLAIPWIMAFSDIAIIAYTLHHRRSIMSLLDSQCILP